jgi:FHA domain
MLNFRISTSSTHSTSLTHSTQRAFRFLDRHPQLARSLPGDIRRHPQQAVRVLAPVFAAAARCQSGEYYIQAVTDDRLNFLATNILRSMSVTPTPAGSGWLLGRSVACSLALPLASVSRFHAVVGYCFDRGFYVLDLRSRNGTYVNGKQIAPHHKSFLHDGDTLQLSHLKFKFLVTACVPARSCYELTQPLSAA